MAILHGFYCTVIELSLSIQLIEVSLLMEVSIHYVPVNMQYVQKQCNMTNDNHDITENC